ncbi:MAG: hypothetical protein ABI413_14490 [Ktedonobacteraceae bacterium]
MYTVHFARSHGLCNGPLYPGSSRYTLIYLAGIALLLYIMILSVQALRLAIQALQKYLRT